MDRNQGGALTLRVLTGQREEMAALQTVLEAVPSKHCRMTEAARVLAEHRHRTLMRKLLAGPA